MPDETRRGARPRLVAQTEPNGTDLAWGAVEALRVLVVQLVASGVLAGDALARQLEAYDADQEPDSLFVLQMLAAFARLARDT